LLARKRFELGLLSLPRAEYPHLVDSAHELVDAQFSKPQVLLKDIVDLMVSGIEAMLNRKSRRTPRQRVDKHA